MRDQQTIGESFSFSGLGLHSGDPASVTVHPAPEDTGIVFLQKCAQTMTSCKASIENIHSTTLCTAIGANGIAIQTVEHLLAALAGMEVDNAYVDFEGNEVPAMDGSASHFVQLVQSVGVIGQSSLRSYLKIVRPFTMGGHDRFVRVIPSTLPKVTYTIEYPHPLIQQQTYVFHWSPREFHKQIAPARTFAFSGDIEALWARGLGQGGSLDNTVVLSETNVLNEDGFRYPDECVRHKIVDFIGDMALLGTPVIGHFIVHCAGHTLHAQFLQAILEHPEAWILLNAPQEEKKKWSPSSPSLLPLSPEQSRLHVSPL